MNYYNSVQYLHVPYQEDLPPQKFWPKAKALGSRSSRSQAGGADKKTDRKGLMIVERKCSVGEERTDGPWNAVGRAGGCSSIDKVSLASMDVVESDAPPSGSKTTRQWDAWTREEEENFFGALRLVGKNFEKITSRVQTKNKDQVRHYYYRVIKRMNKILSPSLVLDAKNSSYVNSAMLRWWSLLEKHSCSASKLRLKPRRFKTFVTALEHQLLKDRKKPKRKSPPSTSSRKQHSTPAEASDVVSVESGECTTSGIASSKAAGDETESPAVGGGRKSAVKRKATNNGSRKSGPKNEVKRPPRPRKKPADGKRPKAANDKGEEGIVGVVNMANAAAELLEGDAAAEGSLPDSDSSNTNCKAHSKGNEVTLDSQTGQISSATSAAFSKLILGENAALVNVTPVAGSKLAALTVAVPNGKKDNWSRLEIIPDLSIDARKSMALLGTRCNNCTSFGCKRVEELNSDSTDTKLKLQLFPFDDRIRKALEQDGLNPHLELTLKARKSISSVLNHLAQKWGRASVATGNLRLFPFSSPLSSGAIRQSWSYLDSDLSAADVHAALGNPAVFRLKYAWFPSRVLETSAAVLQQACPDASPDALGLDKAIPAGSSCTELNSEIPPSASGSAAAYGTSAQMIPPFSSKVSVASPEGISAEDSGDAMAELPPKLDSVVGTATSPDLSPVAVSSLTCSVLEEKAEADTRASPPDSPPENVAENGLRRQSSEEVLSFLTPSEPEVAEATMKAGCKLQEGAAQLSGCGWLYESTDGFAQQLWSLEDSLRSNQVISMTQMDWVDSLTNISVSELIGDGLALPSSTNQNGLDQQHFASKMDSLDPLGIPLQESHMEHSSAIWGGEETCDAFSFQKTTVSDHSSIEKIIPLNHEVSLSSLGLNSGLRDTAPLNWREQFQSCQSQDLMFGGEASVGLGGLIEALAANGSLDGFQVDSFRQLSSDDGNLDSKIQQVHEVSIKSQDRNIYWDNALGPKTVVSAVTNFAKAPTSVGKSADIWSNLSERAKDDRAEVNIQGASGSMNYSNVILQAIEPEVPKRSASVRTQRQTDTGSSPSTFKLSDQFKNSLRSLKT
ncbi:hypothetical protein R1sor_022985 [Riccia sorocarpa]|uniref:SANT domain-containing protein n=1 Tax=Riccia sorocarpa TaxID=122646 RepID=A0ABD3GSB9_9MARC